MAVYFCQRCDRYMDGDYFSPVEDPENDNELICEHCAEIWLEPEENN